MKNRYEMESARLSIQIVDSNTEKTFFTIENRNFLNVGEMFTERVLNSIIETSDVDVDSDEIMVIAVGVFKKKV